MKQLNQEEAKRICDRVLSFSKADECSVAINGSRQGNIRFARNSVSTAGLNEDRRLSSPSPSASARAPRQVNEFDDKSLEQAVRRAEDTARLAPENPEYVPCRASRNSRRPAILRRHRRDRSGLPRRSGLARDPGRAQEANWSPPASSATPPASRPSPTRKACSATASSPASISPAPRAPRMAAVRAG
jgi:hypothetical protein